MTNVKIGDKAPDFTLQSDKGGIVTLSEFFGKKKVILFFYPMDESPVCSREAEAFRDNYEAFNELDAEVVGISSQSVESHKEFASHRKLPYILLSDTDNRVRKLYGVSTSLGIVPGRVTYVIDEEGIIKHIFSSQLHPAKHAKEALRALREQEHPTASATKNVA
ncbi:MAG TPA: peroxiredoxin [Candidatus Bathyarchaeia archaeon]|nr:peroxiredoxin [Candidatus Bathyarchaeia archaeon]